VQLSERGAAQPVRRPSTRGPTRTQNARGYEGSGGRERGIEIERKREGERAREREREREKGVLASATERERERERKTGRECG